MSSELDRRTVLKSVAAFGAAATAPTLLGKSMEVQQRKSVYNYAAPKMDTVRVGFIGVGARGSGHVAQMLVIEGVEVKAIADPHIPSANASARRCVDKGRPAPTLYTNGPKDYLKLLDRDDIDIVIISTPWELHAEQAVAAMKRGKHAFIEVPACLTVDECWQLVDTAERTQRHCMMMENVNYGREELMVLNMCRLGLFGEILHTEAAYIHDLRWQMKEVGHGTGSWRTLHYAKRDGNLYPTHGLGPVAQYMNINRGDRFDYLTSMSSPSRMRDIYKETLPDDNPHKKLDYICGDINTTLVKTKLGRSIMIQWDEQLPRPYNRLNFVQGTKGTFGGFPNRIVVEGKTEGTESWDTDMKKWFEEFDHPLWKRMGEEAQRNGGHGGMDFIMLWRIVYCLRNGLPLDQDVYDAAAWSVITPLSEWSVKNRSRSIDVPDFTRGKWKDMEPLGIVS